MQYGLYSSSALYGQIKQCDGCGRECQSFSHTTRTHYIRKKSRCSRSQAVVSKWFMSVSFEVRHHPVLMNCVSFARKFSKNSKPHPKQVLNLFRSTWLNVYVWTTNKARFRVAIVAVPHCSSKNRRKFKCENRSTHCFKFLVDRKSTFAVKCAAKSIRKYSFCTVHKPEILVRAPFRMYSIEPSKFVMCNIDFSDHGWIPVQLRRCIIA